MGKHKAVKKVRKSDPLSRNVQRDDKIAQERVLPLLKMLTSPKMADRAVAIGAMNALADDSHVRSIMLREGALKAVLSNTLSDSSQEITSEGYGFVRNLVIDEGRDVAMFLFRQNILASIDSAIKRLVAAWQESLDTLAGQDRQTFFEFAESLLSLLSSLALADEVVYDAIIAQAAPSAVQLAVLVLNSNSQATIEAALQLIYVLSQENPDVAMTIDHIDTKFQALAARIYHCGIQYNMHRAAGGPLLPILQTLTGEVSNVDLQGLQVPDIDNVKDPRELKALSTRISRIKSQISAVQVSLELFGAIFESLAQGTDSEALSFAKNSVATIALDALQYQQFAFRAATILNNAAWTFLAVPQDWNELAQAIWAAVTPLLQTEDADLATAAVGSLGAISTYFEGNVPAEQVDSSHIVQFSTSLQAADKDSWVLYVQPAMVFLSKIAQANMAFAPDALELLTSILRLAAELPAELNIEALNELYDLFGDNESPLNAVYQQYHVNELLKELSPALKRSINSVKASHSPILYEQGCETLLNLTRFIEYKASA